MSRKSRVQKPKPLASLKESAAFTTSLRIELCFALAAFVDSEALQPTWREIARRTLMDVAPPTRELLGIGPLWISLPDAWQDAALASSFDDFIRQLNTVPLREFQNRLFDGIFHDEDTVTALMRPRINTSEAIGKASPQKREWLAHMGLYPFDGTTSFGRAIELLRSNPHKFRRTIVGALEACWRSGFASAWISLQKAYETSIGYHSQLFRATALQDFFRLANIRIEVDERSQILRALRGGYFAPAAEVAKLYLVPSAFNRNEYWYAYDKKRRRTFICPYYDPRITDVFSEKTFSKPDAVDPALLLRALGDPTRYAILSLLARTPRTSAEVAQALGLSRPTVSHHVNLLREAGIVDESLVRGSVTLVLRRATLEALSSTIIAQLYSVSRPAKLQLTRKKRK